MRIIILLTILIFSSCLRKEKSTIEDNNNIPHIDLQKKYSQEDLYIQDIADVTYIPLETTEESVIGVISDIVMHNDTIIICDRMQGKILFFNTDGDFLHTFKNRGPSKKEYSFIFGFSVDFKYKEIFILDQYAKKKILVYDFKGNFCRELDLEPKMQFETIYNYNNDYLFAYDTYGLGYSDEHEYNQRPYFLICKKTGDIINIPLEIKKRISSRYISIDKKGNSKYSKLFSNPILKYDNGIIISEYTNDTIYYFKNNKFHPFIIRKSDNTKKDVLLSSIIMNTNNYSFVWIESMKHNINEQKIESTSGKGLLYRWDERKINEITLLNADYPSRRKWINFNNYNKDLPKNYTVSYYYMDILLKASEDNKLKGDLKNIVSVANEEDNPILIILKFRE